MPLLYPLNWRSPQPKQRYNRKCAQVCANDRNAAFRPQQRKLFHWLRPNVALLHSKRWRVVLRPL
jgi:hypothetical protein